MATIQSRKSKSGEVSYTVTVRRRSAPPKTATFPTRTEAKDWGKCREAEIREHRHFPTAAPERHTMREMIERYIKDVLPQKKPATVTAQTRQLNRWKAELGEYRISDVTPPLIIEKRDKLLGEDTFRKKKRSNASVCRHLAALSHCYTIAIKEWQWANDNPVRKVSKPREPRGRTRFLSTEERVRLLTECKESRCECLYTVVVLALSTGMRRNEIMSLRWADVSLERGELTLNETKSGEIRVVPLVGLAHDLMKERARTRRIDTKLCFPAPLYSKNPSKPYDIQSAWDWAVERAKLEDFRFHDLRHSTASYLAMQGKSLTEVGALLGHKQPQTTARYSHLARTHLSKIAADLNAELFGEQSSAAAQGRGNG